MKLLVVALAAAVITGCRAEPAPPPAPSAPVVAAPVVSEEPRRVVLYDLDLQHLVDSSGKSIELDVHRGHPVVVSMFYATCPSACPALMLEMKDMDRRLSEDARKDVRYLLVSFDPERDDVAALARARADHALDDRWTFSRTDEREVRVLATALGLRYRFRTDGEIDHTTNLALVRPDGTLDVQVDGLAQPKDEMIGRIAALAE